MKPVVHIIEEVIARMLDRYPDLKYHYGTRQEIITTFTEMTESITIKSSMFPAICLIMPFKETVKGSGNRDINLNLLILTDSKQEFSTPDRYAYNYVPILYPLLELFIEKAQCHHEILPQNPEYERTDQVSWGRYGLDENKSQQFNDYIDAIEIENLKLEIISYSEKCN
jgi:hypothetical protein